MHDPARDGKDRELRRNHPPVRLSIAIYGRQILPLSPSLAEFIERGQSGPSMTNAANGVISPARWAWLETIVAKYDKARHRALAEDCFAAQRPVLVETYRSGRRCWGCGATMAAGRWKTFSGAVVFQREPQQSAGLRFLCRNVSDGTGHERSQSGTGHCQW